MIIMNESTARRKLNKMGFALKRKTFTGVTGGKEVRYSIVDQNNGLVAGEFTMSLEDVENWIKSE